MRAVADDYRPAPHYARPFVAAFLLTLVVCALAPFNPWPFSDWELFSRLRTDRQSAWQVIAVEATGRKLVYPIALLPHGYRGFASTMAEFSERSATLRDATCEAWLRGAGDHLGTSTSSFRIYELSWLLSGHLGNRPGPRRRILEWTCSAKGARDVG